MSEQRLSDLDFRALTRRSFFPSPAAWEDQVLYFLMLDRFSDGNENGYRDNDGNPVTDGATPLFQLSDAGNAVTTEEDVRDWFDAGAASSAARFMGWRARSAI